MKNNWIIDWWNDFSGLKNGRTTNFTLILSFARIPHFLLASFIQTRELNEEDPIIITFNHFYLKRNAEVSRVQNACACVDVYVALAPTNEITFEQFMYSTFVIRAVRYI